MASTPVPSPAVSLVHTTAEETLTGEAVALDVQPIGFFLRAVGAVIDVVIGAVLLFGGALLLATLTAQGSLPESALGIGVITLLVLVMVAVPTTVETLSRGRSLGRLAVGARIVRTDGGASGFRQALIRALTGVLEIWFTFGAIAAVVGMFTPRSQRLGDLLAGTASERTRTPRLPLEAPASRSVSRRGRRSPTSRVCPTASPRDCRSSCAGADALTPAARARVAVSLAEAVRPFVSPIPAVDAESLVRAVSAVRRDREYRALLLENERAAALTERA